MSALVAHALIQDDNEESLGSEIAYYKAMLAELTRITPTSRACMTPEMVRQRLVECEHRLARMRKLH